MIIVDTNVLIYLYVQGDFTDKVTEVYLKDDEWIAPPLWLSEFRNTMALYYRQNILDMITIRQIVQSAENFMKKKTVSIESSDVLKLVESSSCSAYDCEFVALAKKFEVPLITFDKKILTNFPEVTLTPDQFLL